MAHAIRRRSNLIGKAIRLDGNAFTVLGVMPEQAQLGMAVNLWTTLAELPGMDRRGLHFLTVIGRLKPGVTMTAAQSDLSSIAAALAAELRRPTPAGESTSSLCAPP